MKGSLGPSSQAQGTRPDHSQPPSDAPTHFSLSATPPPAGSGTALANHSSLLARPRHFVQRSKRAPPLPHFLSRPMTCDSSSSSSPRQAGCRPSPGSLKFRHRPSPPPRASPHSCSPHYAITPSCPSRYHIQVPNIPEARFCLASPPPPNKRGVVPSFQLLYVHERLLRSKVQPSRRK